MNSPQVYSCYPSGSPFPTSLPTPSLWVIPVHQPRASSIMQFKIIKYKGFIARVTHYKDMSNANKLYYLLSNRYK